MDVRDRRVLIEASTLDEVPVSCPGCQTPSGRVHRRYGRRLADAPCGGRGVVIELSLRRLFCDNKDCPRVTFAEQIEGLTCRDGRRTSVLQRMLGALGVVLAARAVARLALLLGIVISRMTVLRLVMALPDPAWATPRVLGIGEFATRKGRRYSTLLVDCEAHQRLDLLPDRDADSVTAWLREHPGVEIVCRDRAQAVADGARAGAPNAQCADRWHVWHNLGEGRVNDLKALKTQHVRPSKAPAAAQAARPDRRQPPALTSAASGLTVQKVNQPRFRTQEPPPLLTRERSEGVDQNPLPGDVHHVAGVDPAARTPGEPDAALEHGGLGWMEAVLIRADRRSAGGTDSSIAVGNRVPGPDLPPVLSPSRCSSSRHAGILPHSESLGMAIRAGLRSSTGRNCLGEPFAKSVPEPWILPHPDTLPENERLKLMPVLAYCPELDALTGHVPAFGKMITELQGNRLPQWIKAVRADDLPSLHAFANGLERDLAAVTAGLTLPWSSGVVESHVNRIKC